MGPITRKRFNHCLEYISSGRPEPPHPNPYVAEQILRWLPRFQARGLLPQTWVELTATVAASRNPHPEETRPVSRNPKTPRPGRRDPQKEAHWRALLAELDASGMGPKAFAEKKGLKSTDPIYWWRNALRLRDEEAARARPEVAGNRLPPQAHASAQPDFLPVRVAGPEAPPTAPAVEVVLPGSGCVLRVPAGADVSRIRDLVHALEA